MPEFKEITISEELEEILKESSRRKILLFKHSTSCPVSARAWKEVQDFINENSEDVLVTMVKVIESRPVSNQAAEDLGVKHQSPQVLLISDGKVIWHTSHQAVTQDNIKKALVGESLPFNLNL
ncbi:bacillithiol system redox-active protein YtxJ [Desulfosporosinus sp. Sb-LF]|uniref:bacillithiol system redox-active protein YtxJ n=1 Tax=Desulfosporosinus sp. Sb-LF TaxID=2560027 RepID=UPI00107F3950|nr:bacillithiol system redox-active protein YtxJ [Desulfosporosinus sp. Sb-LF]TGE33270.1 bacillithiol system redox-active protein YtxJ [Desulfosporosinus sp. Sb-LF]